MTALHHLINYLQSTQVPALAELYGTATDILDQQKLRYRKLLQNFSEHFAETEICVFSSPGRTEIGGNHTDHNHGRVLAGAVTLDNIAVASANDSSMIRIVSAGYDDIMVDCSVTDMIENEKYSSASIVRGICARMKELGYRVGGFNACIDGAVPKGSGLSSSASFEVLIGAMISHIYNEGKLNPIENAKIGQHAENHYFGKPCGLMDQTACAVGGLVTIDFRNPSEPEVKKVDFDFHTTGFSLVITDTGGNHADLNEDYASLPREMKSVASLLGAEVLRGTSLDTLIDSIPLLRDKTGDRAILRAYHFFNDNERVIQQVEALESGNFSEFLKKVIESGYSSFMYNQNIYPVHHNREQGVSLALALSEMILQGFGAWRVHGGGFAGTIQAFVPKNLLKQYVNTLEHVFGSGSCQILSIRNQGVIKLQF